MLVDGVFLEEGEDKPLVFENTVRLPLDSVGHAKCY
jgi:hypothetical protein